MPSPSAKPCSPDELPRLKSTFRLGGRGTNSNRPIYDVQFFPFVSPGVDPVFAVTGTDSTIVCRPRPEANAGLDVLLWLRDLNPEAGLNSIAWAVDPETDKPLLCVAGQDPRIKIFDVESGKLKRTLIGHGAEVNDLTSCLANPHIIASASADHTIRIWHLGSQYEKQPCVALCAGEGHKAGVLTLAFDKTGRYMLSGGFDATVNLWALPNLPSTPTATDHPPRIHYPHFSTTDLHSDYVDCIAFHGPLILSKCARENRILLWRIRGFDPEVPPESQPPAPALTRPDPAYPYETETRSAWGAGYEQLFAFDVPRTEVYYMRFGLFSGLSPQPLDESDASIPAITRSLAAVATHPVLAIGNESSRVFFWDLNALQHGRLGTAPRAKREGRTPGSAAGSNGTARPLKRGRGRPPNAASSREVSVVSSAAEGTPAPPLPPPAHEAHFGGPHALLRAHAATEDSHVLFTARTTAWSPGGEWCVTVGDHGMVMLFRRWESLVEESVEEDDAEEGGEMQDGEKAKE